MADLLNASFNDSKFTNANHWLKTNVLPANMHVERALTQSGVNEAVLNYLLQRFNKNAVYNTIDLPCGGQEFVGYEKELFPNANITAVDILAGESKSGIRFQQMDVSAPFTIPDGEQYDLITSISGVMMFSNTKLFIENCVSRLKKDGTFILTNDNSATLKDKLTFLFFGNLRMFPAVFPDNAWVTENVPVQELIRLLRINGMEVKDVVYTSTNSRDYLLYPLAWIIYPIQRWFLSRFKAIFPENLIKKMYPFKHLFCRHYIIIAEKIK